MKMSKQEFKEEDKVKIIQDNSDTTRSIYNGCIGTLKEIWIANISHPYCVELYDRSDQICVHKFEHIEAIPLNNETISKKYNIEKWLKDNHGMHYPDSIDTGNYRLMYDSKYITFSFSANDFIRLPITIFNKCIIDLINYCNKRGINLSYPEEIQEFEFGEYLSQHGFTLEPDSNSNHFEFSCNLQDFCSVWKLKNDFKFSGSDLSYKCNKSNADILIALNKYLATVIESLEKTKE